MQTGIRIVLYRCVCGKNGVNKEWNEIIFYTCTFILIWCDEISDFLKWNVKIWSNCALLWPPEGLWDFNFYLPVRQRHHENKDIQSHEKNVIHLPWKPTQIKRMNQKYAHCLFLKNDLSILLLKFSSSIFLHLFFFIFLYFSSRDSCYFRNPTL